MKTREFLSNLDDDAIIAAIERAEATCSGEVRLYVEHGAVTEPLPAAQVQFARLGMEKTRERNGVLLFFAPRAQQFAIVGDQAINEKCGEEFWHSIIEEMAPGLKRGEFTNTIVAAIDKVGAALSQHFPRKPDDANELPNQVARD